MKAAPFYCSFVVPLTALLGLAIGGSWIFLTTVVSFGLLPFLDALVGTDENSHRPVDQAKDYDLPLYLFVPVELTVLILSTWAFAQGNYPLSEKIFILINAAIVGGGIGITIAHELVHRQNPLDKNLGLTLLLAVNYMHWADEHVYGHHRDVSTPQDPASAQWGESFYRFLPRTLKGSWLKTWHRESKRQEKRANWWQNPFCFYIGLPLLTATLLALLWGPAAFIFFYAQAFLAALLLELVNYVEHYGLSRTPIPQGGFSKVGPEHSWNSSHKVSNYFLFHLQRHSDHHMYAHHPYQELRHLELSPQLPSGYPLMVLIALCPPLWKKIVHPELEKLKARPPAA